MKIGFVSQSFDCLTPSAPSSIGLVTRLLAERLAANDDVVVFGTGDPAMTGGDTGTATSRVDYRLLAPFPLDRLVTRSWPLTTRVVGALRHGLRPPLSTSVQGSGQYGRAVADAVRRGHFEVLHVQHSTQLLPALRRAAPDATIVLHVHAVWQPQTPRTALLRRIEAADAVLAVSDFVRSHIAAHLPEVADRCTTVPNGVPIDVTGAPQTPGGNEPTYVLFVGALSPHKGVHDLIEAFTILADAFPGLELRVVGPGGTYPVEECFPLDQQWVRERVLPLYRRVDYLDRLHGLVPDRLRDRVSFPGRQTRAQLLEMYSGAAVVVVPSICDEGFGLPALEAMAAGVPVVATRAGGLAEVVADGESGYLVDKGSPEALAAAVGRIVHDPTLRARLGSAGARRAASSYDWATIEESVRSVYRGARRSGVALA